MILFWNFLIIFWKYLGNLHFYQKKLIFCEKI